MCFYDKSFWDILCGLDINTITAMMSVIIAGTALWVSIRGDKRSERRANLSVRPFLTTITNQIKSEKDTDSLREEVNVENCGNGAAIIKNFILEINGKETARKEITRNDIDKNQEFLENNKSGFDFENVGFMYPNSLLKAGDSQNLYAFEYKEADISKIYLHPKINIRIEYQSIYEDEIFVFNTNRFAD